jgi:hypothetical protein
VTVTSQLVLAGAFPITGLIKLQKQEDAIRFQLSVNDVARNNENTSLQTLRERLVPDGYEAHGALPKLQEHGLGEKENPPLQTLWSRLEPARYEVNRSLPRVREHGLEEKLAQVD